MTADGGAENSKALRLQDGQQLQLAFGGGRLGALTLFARGEQLEEGSQALIRVYGNIGDEEQELATVAVSNLSEAGEVVNLFPVISDWLYQLEGIRLVAEGFGENQSCIIDNVTYKASPACERTQVMNGVPVNEPTITLTGLDPENEYYVGVKGVKNEEFISDFLGYAYVPGMPAPKVTEATDIEKRGAYTANWTPSPKAQSYTLTNYIVNTVAEDKENYVVLRDDFSKADEAAQEYVDKLYFDDWTDYKGWHTDRLPDNFMTRSLADAGYIGTLGLPVFAPTVSLDNGGGKFTVRFKVKAFGGELIAVYSNGQVQYYDFAQVNPGGDPYSFEEHEVEMEFDNGSEMQTIIVAGTYYTVLLDWFEITQDVKAGDKVLRFESTTDLAGHDAAEYRFTGLQNAADVTYAYNVVAHGSYMGEQFSSMPSALMKVDLNAMGIDGTAADGAVMSVAGVRGGIALLLSEASEVNVFTVSGMRAASVKAPNGSSFISVPAGFYIVKAGDRTFKVTVK